MRMLLYLPLFALLAAFGQMAFADEFEPSDDTVKRHAHLLLLRQADADADGQVTAEEWQAMTSAIGAAFADIDDDGDGQITVPTRRARHHRGGRAFGDARADMHRHRARRAIGHHLMAAADRAGDGDGTLGRNEWLAFLGDADADSDGNLSHRELAEAFERQRPEPPADGTSAGRSIGDLLERFDSLDANGDGLLDEDERPRHRRRARTR